MESFKKWIAIIAVMSLVLMTMLAGIGSAAAEGEEQPPPAEEVEGEIEAPDSEGPADEEPASDEEPAADEEPASDEEPESDEEPAADEEPGAVEEEPAEVEEPADIDGDAEGEGLPEDETEDEAEDEAEDPGVDNPDEGEKTKVEVESEGEGGEKDLCCPRGTISGVKFKDLNCNGKRDCCEPGMFGVTITLKKDGQVIDETKTNICGKYSFERLSQGRYTVCEGGKPGYFPTTPECRDVHLQWPSGMHKMVNFGNAPYGFICGRKYLDKNCDGDWDLGEHGIKGVTITLRGEGYEASTQTGCLGFYCFKGLKPGLYEVSVDESTAPPGTYPSTPNPVNVRLCCGEKKCVWFGNAPGGSISGYKFLDEDCDGEWDEGEPGIEGVIIKLRLGERVWKAETDSNGYFSFDGLEPGKYKVKVKDSTMPESHYHTTPNPQWVKLCCGEQETVNFGNARYGSISGYKFLDEDCDGDWDEGEPGIEGVTVCLETQNDNHEDLIVDEYEKVCTITDEEGRYCFSGLMPGDYTVWVDESTAPENTYPSTPSAAAVELGCGEDEVVDFGNAPYGRITGSKLVDEDGDETGDTGLDGVTIELWQNEVLIDSDITHDGGAFEFADLEGGTYLVKEIVPLEYYPISPTEEEVVLCGGEEEIIFINALYGRISGTKYFDADGDGIIDPDDSPLEGVSITLTEKGKLGAMAVTPTAVDGTFSFTGLKAGTYVVAESVPEGYYQTAYTEWELYIGPGDDIPVVFLNAPYASVSGTKWNDADGDGVVDPDETGMGGVTVILSGTTLSGVKTTVVTTTNPEGSYYFNNLEAGTYTVKETVPYGYMATSPESREVILVPGDRITGIDFLNTAVDVGGVVTPPPVTPQPGGQLPYTGLNQLLLILGAGLLVLTGMIALTLGTIRSRKA